MEPCDHFKIVSYDDGPWICARCKAVNPARPKYETRPTADLGEELVALTSAGVDEIADAAVMLADAQPGDERALWRAAYHGAMLMRGPLADRLILYREALDPDTLTNRIWDKLITIDTAPGVGDTMLTYAELKEAISAVLSRSGG